MRKKLPSTKKRIAGILLLACMLPSLERERLNTGALPRFEPKGGRVGHENATITGRLGFRPLFLICDKNFILCTIDMMY
jgi:hypothetical protein